jgi:pimeloyl-ACP methyl ester carboxylesterase
MAHRWVDVRRLRLHCVKAAPARWWCCCTASPRSGTPGATSSQPSPTPATEWSRDLCGYKTSDKPPLVRDYRPRVLTQDVADLIVALGAGSTAVARHDWGGALAWLLATHHPKRVQRLVVLNAPHPLRFLKGLSSPRQLGGGPAVVPEVWRMAMFPTSAQQAWDQAVRVRADSKRLREQLACVADRVAEVEEQCAAIHDAMAAHAGPVVHAAERAARARRFAAVERAAARAYRLGIAPPDVAWATLRRVDQPLIARPRLPPSAG